MTARRHMRLTPDPFVTANDDSERDRLHGIDPEDPAFAQITKALLDLVVNYGFDPHGEGVAARAIEAGRKTYELDRERALAWQRTLRTMPPPDTSVVYYMRIGNRCKIGFSMKLGTRLATINPEELLATEPGGLVQEAKRHSQFRHLHSHGEWFRYEGELVEHVTDLQGMADAG